MAIGNYLNRRMMDDGSSLYESNPYSINNMIGNVSNYTKTSPYSSTSSTVTAAPVQTSGPTNEQPWSPKFLNIPGIGDMPYFRVSDLNWGPYENNLSDAMRAWQNYQTLPDNYSGPRDWESILKTETVPGEGGDSGNGPYTIYIAPELKFRGNPSDYGEWGTSVFGHHANWDIITDPNNPNIMGFMIKTGGKEGTVIPYVRQGDVWVPQTQGIQKRYWDTNDSFGNLALASIIGLPFLFGGLASAGLIGGGEAAAGAGEALGTGVAESFPISMPSAPIMSELPPLTEIGAGGAGAATGAIDPWFTEPGFAPPVSATPPMVTDPWLTEPGFSPPVSTDPSTAFDPWFTEPGFEPPISSSPVVSDPWFTEPPYDAPVSPSDPWFTEPGFEPPVNPEVPDPWMTEPGFEPPITSNPATQGIGDLFHRIGQIGNIAGRLFGGSGGGNQMVNVGGNSNGLLGLLSAIYGARQSREYANMLRQIAGQMQEQASPYINKLRESYENPNAYLQSPEMQAILNLEANRLAGIDAAQGRLSNDINRTAKLQQLAQSRLADYRRGLQQSIERIYQPLAVASLFREAAGRQANAWQGIPQFFGAGGSAGNVWNDIKNIIDTGKDIWDVISGWWD
jgi:hypothetical protein